MRIGLPKDRVMKYETALMADKYVLMVHGSDADGDTVRSVLAHAAVETIA